MTSRLTLCFLGASLAGLVACAGRDPAVTPPSPVFGTPRAAAPRPGPPAAIPAPSPGQAFDAPSPGAIARDPAALAAACRQDADRIVQFRDRGQLMREDDRDARLGTDSGPYTLRMDTNRLGRIYERDRIAADCVRQNTRSAPQQQR